MGAFPQPPARYTDEAWELMAEIGQRNALPGPGTTRAAFRAGEQLAMEAVTAFAEAQGLPGGGAAGAQRPWQP